MGRLVIIVIMLIISGIIYLIKAAAGKVTGNEVNFQDESKKVMNSAAKGVNWMNDQWDKAKKGQNTVTTSSINLSSLSATELIASVKLNSVKYPSPEAVYIEQAVIKMNNRQFDDARKIVMQLQEGEARDFMLSEIEQKRNV